MSDKDNRYLPNYADQMRLLMAERPMVLWHWRHIPYREAPDNVLKSGTEKRENEEDEEDV